MSAHENKQPDFAAREERRIPPLSPAPDGAIIGLSGSIIMPQQICGAMPDASMRLAPLVRLGRDERMDSIIIRRKRPIRPRTGQRWQAESRDVEPFPLDVLIARQEQAIAHIADGGQSRMGSLRETVASTAIGYAVAVASQVLVFPLFGIETTMGENLAIAGYFTAISIARGYAVRRLFNAIRG